MGAPLQGGAFGQLRHGRAGMGVGNGQAQRVGCIGAGQAREVEQAAHHFLNLRFGCASMSCYGFFHLQGGVFGHRQLLGDQRSQTCTARLPQQQRGLRVDVDEHDFKRSHAGLVGADDLRNAFAQQLDARGQIACIWQIGIRTLAMAAGRGGNVCL